MNIRLESAYGPRRLCSCELFRDNWRGLFCSTCAKEKVRTSHTVPDALLNLTRAASHTLDDGY